MLVVDHRLKATATMSGTLRVARVPYDKDHAKYDEAVDLLDQYSGSYPIKGSLSVSAGKRKGGRIVRCVGGADDGNTLREPPSAPPSPWIDTYSSIPPQ